MLIQADASGLEWRVLVELAQDAIGIEEIVSKADIHTNNQKAFSLPSRLIAKKYLFRTIYRGTGWAFANDNEFMHVSTSAKYWDNVNEMFYNKYKGIDILHNKWYTDCIAGRNIVGPLGREWFISTKNKDGEFVLPINSITNYPVQGTGADIVMIARVSIFNKVKSLGLLDEIKFVSSVHDSIVLDIPDKHLDLCKELFYKTFDDLIPNIKKIFGYEWKTPLGCECKWGPNMAEMEKG